MAHHNFVPPLTSNEVTLLRLWESVLCVNTIGISDNFFDLGGDSLSATRIINRIRVIFHVELPIRTLFDFPTIAAQAHIIGLLASTRDRKLNGV